jgi:ribose/xylose/arabinose/galactoside ABC-type transport system permease subunit
MFTLYVTKHPAGFSPRVINSAANKGELPALGGHGTFLGAIAGMILITLLQSILSVVQMPEAGRQIIYGIVAIVMLLLYGRERVKQ